jgi:hypothetical protein
VQNNESRSPLTISTGAEMARLSGLMEPSGSRSDTTVAATWSLVASSASSTPGSTSPGSWKSLRVVGIVVR